MGMTDIIIKKRDGGALSEEDINYFVRGVTRGEIPNEQSAALLMAIYLNGMNDKETLALTLAMAHSGDMADLSSIAGIKADKHSTGGVGDKTTMIVAPIVAACGTKGNVRVAKLSGRGLGHTGGTVDKLMSIPGFRTELSQTEFIEIVNKHGLCLAGQSDGNFGGLAPADKKIYALRDITGAVESIPLIASSIMSKKLAAGADCILLDVKCGSGAFMKSRKEAAALAKLMVAIGTGTGKKTVALITDMNRPLGRAIGNALEVAESVEVLSGRCEKGDLYEICILLSAYMLHMAGMGTLTNCHILAKQAIASGAAMEKFKDMVAAQGGDISVLDDTSRLPQASYTQTLTVPVSGYIESMDMYKWGIASMLLGAGREKTDDKIDYGAGIYLYKKPGDMVRAGDLLAKLYTGDAGKFSQAGNMALSGITIGEEAPPIEPLVYKVIG